MGETNYEYCSKYEKDSKHKYNDIYTWHLRFKREFSIMLSGQFCTLMIFFAVYWMGEEPEPKACSDI